MKTRLLTLTGILTLTTLIYAQNPKEDVTTPVIRPEAPKAETCPTPAQERVTHPCPSAHESTATVTTNEKKQAPTCQMPKGGHCGMN